MPKNKIKVFPDEVLRRKAQDVKRIDNEILDLIEDMVEAMRGSPIPGVGLAAPQVGVSKRIVIVDAQDGQGLQVVINPKILKLEGEKELGWEGCLSVPGIYGEVSRYPFILLKGLNKRGKGIKIEATGFRARVFQHEIDHLDGILFIDKAIRFLEEKDPLEESLQEKIIAGQIKKDDII